MTSFHKYKAKPTIFDGIRFASKSEAKRYAVLKLLQDAGEIRDLKTQYSIAIDVNGKHICNYVADFHYYTKTGRPVVEDVKGFRTPVYKLKKKLVEAVHGIEIREVK